MPAVSPVLRHAAEHLFALLLVGGALAAVVVTMHSSPPADSTPGAIEAYLDIDSVNFASPLQRTLFREAFAETHAMSAAALDSVLQLLERDRLSRFTDPEKKAGGARERLTWESAARLLPMYVSFLVVYAIVMVVTFLAARTIAIARFAAMKRGRASFVREYFRQVGRRGPVAAVGRIGLLFKAILRGAAYGVFFSPAYVIAYAFRTRIDTENLLFMVLLGVVSNGLLINYANKFYGLLVSESRKGYVETAMVKGLRTSYRFGSPDGLPLEALAAPLRRLRGHVFRHIYLNARFQFILSLKEHAAFLVTGLVIIEMALNIKGHLCYTLLQHILFREYDLVILIVFGIFSVVKATELVVDIWHGMLARRYGNA
jgi:hypothetical protein